MGIDEEALRLTKRQEISITDLIDAGYRQINTIEENEIYAKGSKRIVYDKVLKLIIDVYEVKQCGNT